jgi:hypothetical protein
VADEQVAEAVRDAALGDDARDGIGDILETAPRRSDADLLGRYGGHP